MALKAKITADEFSGLSEELQSEYKADGDGYVIDVVPVDGMTLANTGDMQTALQRERQKAADAEKALKKYKIPGTNDLIDPAKAQEAMSKMDEIDSWDPEDKLREHKERFETQVREQFENQKRQIVASHEEALSAVAGENKVLSGQLDDTLRRNTAIAAISAAKGNVKSLLPYVLSQTETVVDDTTKKRSVIVKGDNGMARLSPASADKNMSVEELVQEIKVDRDMAGHFQGSGASGSGASGGNSGAGGGTGNGSVNPFMDKSFNLTEQGRLLQVDPGEYKRLQREAIGREPEGKAAKMQAAKGVTTSA